MPRKQNLSLQWFDDAITTSEKDERRQLVKNSAAILKILADRLNKRLEALENQTDFNTPAWQFELAKSLGQKEEIKDLLKLLTPVIED